MALLALENLHLLVSWPRKVGTKVISVCWIVIFIYIDMTGFISIITPFTKTIVIGETLCYSHVILSQHVHCGKLFHSKFHTFYEFLSSHLYLIYVRMETVGRSLI